jgi:prolyl-tRNA editing enzyme YbaK/EbsC (Cys-tRNA(Pro) deacylase)
MATPDEILEKTGYPCGGTPSFGYEAMFLVDPRVMEREVVYTGGGSETSLVKIGTEELVRANHGTILRIRS